MFNTTEEFKKHTEMSNFKAAGAGTNVITEIKPKRSTSRPYLVKKLGRGARFIFSKKVRLVRSNKLKILHIHIWNL